MMAKIAPFDYDTKYPKEINRFLTSFNNHPKGSPTILISKTKQITVFTGLQIYNLNPGNKHITQSGTIIENIVAV